MNKFTKIFAVAAAALTISAGTLATSSEAHAFGKGKGLGIGIAAAIIGTTVGVIAASAAPRCKLVERFDRRGNYRGTIEVCR
jgi:hypothetical protein